MRVIHLILLLLLLAAAWRWADWKNWKLYYPTMLYSAAMNLLYEIFSNDQFFLWQIQPDFIFPPILAKLLHIFVINPLITLLYLSKALSTLPGKLYHTVKWVVLLIIGEWVAFQFGAIIYANGWSLAWSLLFVVVMFLMLWLHHNKTLWALLLSMPCILFYLFVFDYYNLNPWK